jgi:hypothetical protein
VEKSVLGPVRSTVYQNGDVSRVVKWGRRTTYYSTGCLKKSFTTLKEYIHLFRGHIKCFEMS